MTIKRTLAGVAIVAAGWVPSAAFAEVSDKMPSVPIILVLGFLIGAGIFFLARFRWWLGVVLSPIPLLFIAESISIWNEMPMREALLREQGWVYFGALGLQGALFLVGITAGVIVGYRRSKPRRITGKPLVR